MIRAYYNEIEPYAADWIRNLISARLITPGDVDTRSILDVHPSDLRGYQRCHFFAGIAVWDYALKLAGWPADRPVWTGSCPCQPFSAAGLRAGLADERHLWPAWFHLISECRPATVVGEQVASADGLGWLDLVHADMDGLGYSFGAADLCAAGVGAPHIRQRLWFVGDADTPGRSERAKRDVSEEAGEQASRGANPLRSGFWADSVWITCRDGKTRPAEPGTFPLAHGASSRVGRLRAYGNAINAEVAQVFIKAVMEVRP